MILIALAAGQPVWVRFVSGIVTVMVDLSPSTRGAVWRDRTTLNQRISQILGDAPYRAIGFGESNHPLPEVDSLPDFPSDRTVFAPPPSDAVVLFSDGQFELPPFCPRTFVVIDPSLDAPADGGVKNLEFRGDRVVGSIQNSGQSRSLNWTGATPEDGRPVAGSEIRSAVVSHAGLVRAALSAGDLWPENDSLSIESAPRSQLEKWWIGNRNPGLGWQVIQPAELSDDPAAYLNAAVIVLDNISADALSSRQKELLAQYSRDLGGGLILIGGEHTFGNGNYDGTVLDQISPLASSPPGAAEHWILVADGSGSMAVAGDGDRSRWQMEVDALLGLLPHLPPEDRVSVGSFAGDVRWWSMGKSARDTAALPLPPAGVEPNGPTPLQLVLKQIVESADGAMPTQVLLMTDGEADVADLGALGSEMIRKKIHLHLLAIGDGSATVPLQSLANATGGSLLREADPRQWITGARQLLQSAMPDRLSHEFVSLKFIADLGSLQGRQVGLWNRTWLKAGATELVNASLVPMGARWQFGEGRVGAMAFQADMAEAMKLAEVVAVPPRDPGFTVTWKVNSMLRVRIDAVDRGAFMNGLAIQLKLWPSNSSIVPFVQTAPGRYEAVAAAPRSSVIVAVRSGKGTLARFAVAGRYPVEFEVIGNDRANLKLLAERTGGAVIEAGAATPIDFKWGRREMALGSWLAAAGAVCFAAALVAWRAK